MLKTKQKTLIHQTELDYISRCIQDYPNLEIGGDLFGFYTTTGLPVVQLATGPGPKAQQTVHAFYQDEEYLIEVGNCLRKSFGMQHIGEWHSHHQLGLDWPSPKDNAVISNAMKQYNLSSFLLVIGNYVDGHSTLNSYNYHFSSLIETYPEHSKWVVLSEPSPIRTLLEQQNWFEIYKPNTVKAKIFGLQQTNFEDDSKTIYPDEYWLNEEKNRELLHSIFEKLYDKYEKVKLFQHKSSHEVFIDIKNTKDTFFRITFKEGFPHLKPDIVLALNAECEGYLPSVEYDWNPNNSIYRQTIDYIDQVILELQNCYLQVHE